MRLVLEYGELVGRITLLQKFILNDNYKALDEEKRHALQTQLNAMINYREALLTRIVAEM